VTRRVLTRSFAFYAVILVAGAVLSLFVEAPWLRSFGLGLMVPGGGFLLWATGETSHVLIHAGLAAATLVAFAGTLALWFGTGNAVAPFALWLISAGAAAAMSHSEPWEAAPIAVILLVLSGFMTAGIAVFIAALWGSSKRRQANTLLLQPDEPRVQAPRPELGASDVALLRLLLDRALQPLDRFDGFDVIDQFQTAALRYQLNFVGYALSMFQHAHAPAFRAYLSDAQSNLILKQCDRRVWSYWNLENLWGNLERNADPMARDNVMFTGFVATQISAFESASGDRQFSGPGSLVFAGDSGERFVHDLPKMIETLRRNIGASRFQLIACEPNWIFPLCNSIAFAAIRWRDSALWETLAARILTAIDDEFLTASGELVACRSSRIGFAVPALGGAAVQTLPCLFFNATLPDLAQRQWRVQRPRLKDAGNIARGRFWPIDTGNYRFSRASSYAATAAAAAEMGDSEMAAAILARLDDEHPTVTRQFAAHRPGVSLWAHAAEVLARIGRQNAFRDMMTGKHVSADGPVIAAASYPDVLPVRAIAKAGRLDCVLRPGGEGGRAEIGVAGLIPGGSYRWQGGSFRAEPDGTARLTLTLEGRTELSVVPVA
jgi:hypothetical protein